MTQHELMPAITLMERKVDEAERKVTELLGALNVLRSEAGLPPRPGGGSGGPGSKNDPMPTQIKADTFFGKKQQTAIRQYLDMRRAQGLGPAKPREIYDALLAGGYTYDAKNAEVALVGMRALLRKRSETFVQLSNGTYGLVSWYPEMKRAKTAAASDSEESDAEEKTSESASKKPNDSEAA